MPPATGFWSTGAPPPPSRSSPRPTRDPMGLASRRRYRWTGGRISDYWDEVFAYDGLEGRVALDDQSAFIASLGSTPHASHAGCARHHPGGSGRDHPRPSRGALVVDGGPGTGKTVVALHRAAYLLYSDPRLSRSHGGVLFVGPHQPYLDYVADVLPRLGEEGVETCTLRDLVPEGAAAAPEPDPAVVRLKASARMVTAIEPAVALYEEPPTSTMRVETPWGGIRLTPDDWAEAFAAPEDGTAHNDARDEVWEALLAVLMDHVDDEVPRAMLRRSLARNGELTSTFVKAWPLLDADYVVANLWSVPAYLRRCAPWLEPGEVRMLQRRHPSAWTTADLPLLDAARRRLGDPEASVRRRRRDATLAAERERRAAVIDDLIASDDSDLMVMSMLRGEDAQNSLDDESAMPDSESDPLAGPFTHIVVDEAQELTDAEWQMLLLRCPSRSFTIVGDRAQARHGFTESWQERLDRVGIARMTVAPLTINYRTPEEVMREAEPVIRAAIPDANVPSSIRRSGIPVLHATRHERDSIVGSWLDAHDEGVACVIGDPAFPPSARVRSLTPELAKGLEFDLVVLVDPDSFGTGIEGAVDRYVAMTRATGQLVVLTDEVPRGATKQ